MTTENLEGEGVFTLSVYYLVVAVKYENGKVF
jgi:hypothetical protein